MFVLVGVIGVALIVLFLVFDDFLDGVLPDADWISGPVIGAFLAAFGIVGWTVTEAFDAPTWLASLAGVAGGIALGYLAFALTRSLLHSPTDATPSAGALMGREGRVVTGATPGQLGEVLVTIGGQPVKLSAVSDDELARGSAIVVIDVTSPTRVVVQLADRFWAAGTATTAP
jgi:membrane protein implicated in regulation of membrane protease activity